MQTKSYEALRVEEFISRIIEQGYKKCFVVFKDEVGAVNNLVFDNKELFVTSGKKKELWKPYPETLYHLLKGLKHGKYDIIGYGQYKEDKADQVEFGADQIKFKKAGVQ